MTYRDLTILVPMLGRPHLILSLVQSIESATPGAPILFLAHGEDLGVVSELTAHSLPFLVTEKREKGDYAHKINQGFSHTDSEWIFCGAIDLKFHSGWFESAMLVRSQNPQAGVIGTNDLGSPEVLAQRHSTHSLISREYGNLGTIDEPDKILHEGYWHEFCDNELVETAKFRHRYAHAHDSYVEHLHPNFGKAPSDLSYQKAGIRTTESAPLFFSRRNLWT